MKHENIVALYDFQVRTELWSRCGRVLAGRGPPGPGAGGPGQPSPGDLAGAGGFQAGNLCFGGKELGLAVWPAGNLETGRPGSLWPRWESAHLPGCWTREGLPGPGPGGGSRLPRLREARLPLGAQV